MLLRVVTAAVGVPGTVSEPDQIYWSVPSVPDAPTVSVT